MKKKYQQFILRLTIISLAVGLVVFILGRLFSKEIISPALPFLIMLFYMVTAIVHWVLLRITTLNPRKFVSYFMLSTSLKLMIYMIVLVAYAFLVKKGVLAFVSAFFILYIIYTVYEVIAILSQTKEKHIIN